VLQGILEHAEAALAAPTAEAASARFLRAMTPLGASYLQTRVYRRPSSRLTSATHFAAGGVISRIAPVAWPDSEAFNYICFECNPLLTPIREGRTRYRFSDFAAHDDPDFGAYWDALSEAGIQEAHCATSYGADGVIASLHLGFAHRLFAPDEAFAVQMAGLVLTERLMSLAAPPPAPSPQLTTRERDSLAFVADGKTDWEIGVILGISEGTARFHVDNARRKLGAVTRAHAVARLVNQRLI
jgi:LuxR family quorum sensing-dependent transcriptional regulator